MISEIKQFEKDSLPLEPDGGERLNLTRQITSYIEQYLKDLPQASAFEEDDTPAKALSSLFPDEQGRAKEELIQLLDASLVKPGINMSSGGDLAYIPGGGLYVSALADYLAAATNKYSTIYSVSPGAIRIENMLVRWMCNLVGYDDKSFGHLSSGGSMANLTAIVAARDAKQLLHEPGKNVIYFTHQVHHCLLKALHISGMDPCRLQLIPMNPDLSMDVKGLEQLIKQHKAEGLHPSLVVASAGTTDVGVVDDLDAVADIAEAHNMWYHVDGAYGGFFLLTAHGRKIMKGISRADSIVMDPHKGLFLPYGSGAVLLKDGHHLLKSFYMEANYLQDTHVPLEQIGDYEEISPADISAELSRHFRGLRLWLPLQLYGIKPFRAALDEKLLLARYFYRKVQEIGFEVGPDPDLSVTIFRYVPASYKNDTKKTNQYNRNLMKAIQNEKKVFIAGTEIDGVYWMRLAVLSFRTHLEHIDTLLSSLKEKTASD